MSNIKVRPFTAADETAVAQMDELSGNYVAQWVNEDELPDGEISDYAFGIFEDETLIGYATIGYADDCPPAITNTPCYNNDQLLLSDVYILPEKRHNGYAKQLCVTTMLHRLASESADHVYATLLCDDLFRFYSKIGFTWCNPDDAAYCIMASRTDIENAARTLNITA